MSKALENRRVQAVGSDYYLPNGKLVVVGPGQTTAQVVEKAQSQPIKPAVSSSVGVVGAWKAPVVNAGFRPTYLGGPPVETRPPVKGVPPVEMRPPAKEGPTVETRPLAKGLEKGEPKGKVPFSRRVAAWVLSAGK